MSFKPGDMSDPDEPITEPVVNCPSVASGDPASRGSSTVPGRAPADKPEVAGSGLAEVVSVSPAPGSQGRTTPLATIPNAPIPVHPYDLDEVPE